MNDWGNALSGLERSRQRHLAGFTALALLHATVLVSLHQTGVLSSSSAEARPPSSRVPRVFLVPIQRVDDQVPTAVASQAQNILNSLFSVQSSMVLLRSKGVMNTVANTPEPAGQSSTDPAVTKANDYYVRGLAAGQAKRWNQTLRHLSMAKGLYEKKLGELNNFNNFVETLMWLARAHIERRQSSKGYALIQQVVAYRPEYIIDTSTESAAFVAAFNRARSAASSARPGTLIVTCLVSECTIFVDGVPRGTGTVTVGSLGPGMHVIRAIAPGHKSWSMQVRAPSNGQTRDLLASLRPEAKSGVGSSSAGNSSAPGIEVDQLETFVANGDFQARFRQTAKTFCSQNAANFLVMGVLNRSAEGYVLGTFLYSIAANTVIQLSSVSIQRRMADMQTKLVSIPALVSKSIKRFPRLLRVTKKPAIYKPYRGSIASTPVVGGTSGSTQPILPPPQAPQMENVDPIDSKNGGPVLIYRPQPIYTPTIDDTTVYQPDESNNVVEPEKRPMLRISTPFTVLERSILLNEQPTTDWYNTWWFWTAVGVVVAGSVTTGVLLGSGQGGSGGWSVSVQLP